MMNISTFRGVFIFLVNPLKTANHLQKYWIHDVVVEIKKIVSQKKVLVIFSHILPSRVMEIDGNGAGPMVGASVCPWKITD